MSITRSAFNVAGPLIGNSAVNIYDNVNAAASGNAPTVSPLSYNPIIEAERVTVGLVSVVAPPGGVVDTVVQDGIVVIEDVAEVVEDIARAVEEVAKDALEGLEWLAEHPFLVIGFAVLAIGGIAYAASTKTNISVSK